VTGRRSSLTTGLLLLAPALLCSSRLAAQNDPRLVAAVRLAQDGLSDSARAVAGRILAAAQPTDSLYPEALYTMGLLAATEQDRRLYLRRVVVDFGQSAWADDALLSLGQLDYAGGNPGGTVRQMDQLLQDYPGSPLAAVAAFWGARAAGDRRDAATACRMADQGLGTTGGDIELKNQLEFQKQRCQSLAAIIAESVRVAAADSAARARADSIAHAKPVRGKRSQPPSSRSAVPSSSRHRFFVQVSAVKTQAAANAEIARIKQAGFSAAVAKEAGYLKIRAGAFKTRADAQAAAADIRTRLGGRPFVVEVP
jgi:cell division septation protein DedD